MKKKRSAYPSSEQTQRLTKYVDADIDMRNGSYSKEFLTMKWQLITDELNLLAEESGMGAVKPLLAWKKTYYDKKCKTKRKLALRLAAAKKRRCATTFSVDSDESPVEDIDTLSDSHLEAPTSPSYAVNVVYPDLLIKNNLDSENIDEETSPNPHISKGLAVVKLEFQENEEDLDITRTSIQSTCKDSNSMVEIVKKRREQRKQHLRLKSLLRRREIRQNNMLFKKIFSQMHRQTDALISIANSVKRIANVLNK